jgi:predicted N-formylglutamate amidohydrolase
VRQDLIATKEDAEAWADRLARLLAPILAGPELHRPADFGSRASGKSGQSPNSGAIEERRG